MYTKTRSLFVGDWKSIDVTDPVKELPDYVITVNNIQIPINKFFNAASQVVSGKNYRFKTLLAHGEIWEVQVNIKKEQSITSFKQINNTLIPIIYIKYIPD